MPKTMFIVDDSESCLTLVASAFEDDYKVLTIPSATKMLTLMNKMTPDIILLDVEMPVMNGFEAIEKLHENPDWLQIPIIIMTGWVTDEVKARAASLGVKEVFAKPFSLVHAMNTVKTLLNE
jgi:putative two-component system response regulator